MAYTSAGAHIRANSGLLVDLERRALIWMAQRIPRRVNSDHLSLLGLSGMCGAGLSFAAFSLTPWAAVGVVISLAINWLGDSLDGTLARVRGHQRPRYGYYVDHVIDLAGATLLMTGLAFSGLMSPIIAAAILAAYLLVSAETYLATHASGVFRMSVLGCGPTELRILIAIGALRAAYEPWVSLGAFGMVRLFDVGAVVAATSLVIVFAVSAIRNTKALYAAEPLAGRIGTLGILLAIMLSFPTTAAAGPSRETIVAWNAYVASNADRPSPGGSAPSGRMVDVPNGTIYHSRGSTLIRGASVDHVVRALMYPGAPPAQEDVLESRVLGRSGDTLRVYLRIARTALVTVVYDTEHQVTFTRHSPSMATSRSVSTRIVEYGRGDRGFLWRLNSYWRYTQVGSDVRVDLESLSLSRAVPRVARAVARPIIDRVARESVVRTLDSVQRRVLPPQPGARDAESRGSHVPSGIIQRAARSP